MIVTIQALLLFIQTSRCLHASKSNIMTTQTFFGKYNTYAHSQVCQDIFPFSVDLYYFCYLSFFVYSL